MTREEAKRILYVYVYRAVNVVCKSHREAFDMAIKSLEQEPRKGMRWIGRFETHEWGKEEWCECPWCHMDSAEAYNFCPNCGADMREVEE